MKKNSGVLILVGLGLACLSMARADSNAAAASGTANVSKINGEALMKKSDCFTCHNVKRKIVGPAYKDVAKKYKGNKTAVDTLVKKVKEGGSGNWGAVPMAAHANLSDADIKLMVQWVLKQK